MPVTVPTRTPPIMITPKTVCEGNSRALSKKIPHTPQTTLASKAQRQMRCVARPLCKAARQCGHRGFNGFQASKYLLSGNGRLHCEHRIMVGISSTFSQETTLSSLSDIRRQTWKQVSLEFPLWFTAERYEFDPWESIVKPLPCPARRTLFEQTGCSSSWGAHAPSRILADASSACPTVAVSASRVITARSVRREARRTAPKAGALLIVGRRLGGALRASHGVFVGVGNAPPHSNATNRSPPSAKPNADHINRRS